MKTTFTLLCLCWAICCHGQDMGVIDRKARHFRINWQRDTIDFIKIDTAVSVKKPVLLLCQGSLPIPLFGKTETGNIFMIGGGVSNFNYIEICKTYHIIVISMPHTPVVVDQKNLNPSYAYIPDPANPHGFVPAYVEADYLDNYVNRANAVIKFLRKQPWVDRSKLIVAGHSQGSKVATMIARTNRHATHLGLFGANPFGRIDQFIRQARKQAEQGKITWEEADKKIENNYLFYQFACNEDSLKSHPENKAWQTFSQPFVDDWLKINIPIYLAYGTEDITADLCDLVPLFFIQEKKTNLTWKRYPGLEHNFFEVTKDGPDYGKGHWDEVMQAFLRWAER